MVEETVWEEAFASLVEFGKVSRFRRKVLRLVNGCCTRKYQISLRERLY